MQSRMGGQQCDLAMGQNLMYLFGVGYHPTIVFFKGFLGVHRGTGVLTHCHLLKGVFFEVSEIWEFIHESSFGSLDPLFF